MEPTTDQTSEHLRREETYEEGHEARPSGHRGKRFSEQSPDEVRQSVKEKVKKGIASVAGALEGLNEEVEEDHLPEKTERAVHNLGETTRKVAGAARQETRQTRESLRKDEGRKKERKLPSLEEPPRLERPETRPPPPSPRR